jgi:hypothetical protein
MRDHDVIFDMDGVRLGFVPADCAFFATQQALTPQLEQQEPCTKTQHLIALVVRATPPVPRTSLG